MTITFDDVTLIPAIAYVDGVSFQAGQSEIWDRRINGLVLRCFVSGTYSWVYRYRDGGGGRSAKLRTLKIGRWPAISIDIARAIAEAYAVTLAQGYDPAMVRQWRMDELEKRRATCDARAAR